MFPSGNDKRGEEALSDREGLLEEVQEGKG